MGGVPFYDISIGTFTENITNITTLPLFTTCGVSCVLARTLNNRQCI